MAVVAVAGVIWVCIPSDSSLSSILYQISTSLWATWGKGRGSIQQWKGNFRYSSSTDFKRRGVQLPSWRLSSASPLLSAVESNRALLSRDSDEVVIKCNRNHSGPFWLKVSLLSLWLSVFFEKSSAETQSQGGKHFPALLLWGDGAFKHTKVVFASKTNVWYIKIKILTLGYGTLSYPAWAFEQWSKCIKLCGNVIFWVLMLE